MLANHRPVMTRSSSTKARGDGEEHSKNDPKRNPGREAKRPAAGHPGLHRCANADDVGGGHDPALLPVHDDEFVFGLLDQPAFDTFATGEIDPKLSTHLEIG
jgi:hypothetical protein